MHTSQLHGLTAVWWWLVTGSVVTFVLCRLLRVVPTPNAHKVDLTVYLKYIIPAVRALVALARSLCVKPFGVAAVPWHISAATRALAIAAQAACQAANLSTSNYTFVYLPVTYIQMLKSLSPALNFLVTNPGAGRHSHHLENPSRPPHLHLHLRSSGAVAHEYFTARLRAFGTLLTCADGREPAAASRSQPRALRARERERG
jgi:hypothetical protein